jgi:hypothetical protein
LKDEVLLSEPNPNAFALAVVKALKSKKAALPSSRTLQSWQWEKCVEPLEKELLKK